MRKSLIVIDTEKDLDQVILFFNLLSDGIGDIIMKNPLDSKET